MHAALRPEEMANRPEETLLQKCEIPIIDLAHVGTDTCPMRSVVRRVGAQLYKALSERGMAMLVNHGIADDKLRAVYADLDKFCSLPETCREQYLRDPTTNQGYVRPGMDNVDNTKEELRHSFNIRSLSVEGMPSADEVPGFLQHAQPLARDFTNLSKLLLQALAYALGMTPNELVECHSGMLSERSDNPTTMRLLYYPPVPPDDELDSEGRPLHASHRFTRCGAHADYGTFTLLTQDSAGGLEVLLRDSDKWQAVGHLQGAILVQPGELLANWTANLFPALMHRVIVPKAAYARARGAHCVAFFCHPDADAAPRVPPPAPPAPQPLLPPRPHHVSLHDRLVSAAHHIHKRFRETYA